MARRRLLGVQQGAILLLVFAWLGGSTPVDGRENEAAAGALSVVTEPAGATVYVDGKVHGPTPLVIDGLPSGDHRVKLIKDGYLENSRVLSLEADRAASLEVTLTPSNERNAGTVEAQISSGGGGGGIWTNPFFLGAVGAGVGTAIYLGVRDTNKPPVAAFGINLAGTGMAGLTSFAFDGSASSDPDGDGLTYSWDYGDGTTGMGVATNHIYASDGAFTVTLTVSDGKEQAMTTGSVSVNRDLSGTWTGSLMALPEVTVSFVFTQDGASLGGTFVFTAPGLPDATGTFVGRIDSPNSFVCPCAVTLTLTFSATFGPATFTGGVDATITSMSGLLTGSIDGQTVTLSR